MNGEMSREVAIKTGAVIPVGAGREENLRAVLRSIEAMGTRPNRIVLVCDGDDAMVLEQDVADECPSVRLTAVQMPKHQPGMEQPRNVGVRMLRLIDPQFTHVWFLDSDVILAEDAGIEMFRAMVAQPDRILIGPYEWLPPGVRVPMVNLKNDPRWPSFRKHSPGEWVTEDLSAGLACFSGNLVWPIDRFLKVGGFWKEIHHGRCEDGELGLRAVAMGVPIGFVRGARGYHLDHPRNQRWIEAANARDVPMLNERHPWVQGSGLFVVEEDGKRFNVACPCGWEGNTAEIWQHERKCPEKIVLPVTR